MEKIWLKNYLPDMPQEIDPDQYPSLGAMIQEILTEHHDQVAFSNFGVDMTYRQLDQDSEYLAAFLQQKLGLKKGERVAAMLPNLLQYPVIILAIIRAGLVLVNVNPLYTHYELEHQLNDAEVAAIFIADIAAHTLQQALPKLSIQPQIVLTSLGDKLGAIKGSVMNFVIKHVKKLVPEYQLPDHTLFNEAVRVGKSLTLQPVTCQGSDLAFLQYTGGTTGVAKGVMLTHRNIVANILQIYNFTKNFLRMNQERVLGALPLYHIYAFTVSLAFMQLGAHIDLITNPRDFKSFMKFLIKTPVTVFIGINTLYNAIANHPDAFKIDFSGYRMCLAGGMAMQPAVVTRWQDLTGMVIAEGYGLTEASPVVSFNLPQDPVYRGSIGIPMPSTDIKICDEAFQELPLHEVGELCVYGPQVMPGYWQRPQETAEVLVDGWLKTGDMAKVDDEGYVYIVDRKKDMILVSGFNVYPYEIEAVLHDIPGIVEAAVIGLPSSSSGEQVCAVVVRDQETLTAEAIRDYCREHMTGYKIPKKIIFMAELPKSNVGKVLKKTLRHELSIE